MTTKQISRMDQVVRFSVPGLAPASYSGNSRAHWRTKHADGDAYAERVWCAAEGMRWPIGAPITVAKGAATISASANFKPPSWKPWPRAKLVLTQKAIRLRDVDNFLSSFKPGLDTLTAKGKRWRLGIVLDDTPECLSIEVKSERVQHKADECVVVEITRLEEP